MTRGDVCNFVRHYAGKFSLVVGCQYQPGVHVEEATGQRKCIHIVGIDYFDCERYLGIGVPHQVLANAIDVFLNDWIGNQFGGRLHLRRIAAAHLDLLFQAVPVAQAAIAAYFAVTNGVDIAKTSVVISFGRLGRTRSG